MYQPMLFVHWKQVRLLLIPFVVAAFGLPLLAVQGLGADATGGVSAEVYQIVSGYQLWLPLFPLLAGAIGIVLALTAWNWDHRLGHVYALSLPVARWEYALLKMGAGIALGLVPTLAFWIGAHVAAASVTLPAGLNAYPNHLALRFFLAMLMAYAFFFALGAGTVKTTVWVVTGIFAALVASEVLGDVLVLYFSGLEGLSFLELATDWLVERGGPFEVFTGNWTLIDV
jgi:hypothetical protein